MEIRLYMCKTGAFNQELKGHTLEDSKLLLVYLSSKGEKTVTSKHIWALWGNTWGNAEEELEFALMYVAYGGGRYISDVPYSKILGLYHCRWESVGRGQGIQGVVSSFLKRMYNF